VINILLETLLNYTIIEDCSPYYIRFTYAGIEQVIEQCSEQHYDYHSILKDHDRSFVHHKLSPINGKKLLESVPMRDALDVDDTRVSFFVSNGGCIYRPHKDGIAVRCGINYTVQINDDKCVTSWYDDKDMSIYPIDTLNGRSREAKGFVRKNHVPLKSMTAKQGECILFNTEIFHDWDNSQSSNIRVLLTLRFKEPHKMYFADAKRILFGI
jgi:hypothetical protein